MRPRFLPPLALLGAVLAAGSASAHDWYRGLTSPLTGSSCCSSRDCEPVPSRFVNGELQLYGNGVWTPALRDAFLGVAAPDAQVHACWANRRPGEAPKFVCIMLGGEV